jgi:hypothetical protein
MPHEPSTGHGQTFSGTLSASLPSSLRTTPGSLPPFSHTVWIHVQGDSGAWLKESKYQKNHYKAKKGMDIGEVKVMLHVQVLRGMKVRKDGSRTKMWRTVDDIYPLQVISGPRRCQASPHGPIYMTDSEAAPSLLCVCVRHI